MWQKPSGGKQNGEPDYIASDIDHGPGHFEQWYDTPERSFPLAEYCHRYDAVVRNFCGAINGSSLRSEIYL